MLSKIRKLLLKFPPFRAAVTDYQRRQKDKLRHERWAKQMQSSGMVR